jgi:hypothetical protein
MRVAALYDIHGNLPALEAVLRDVQLRSCRAADRIRTTSYPEARQFVARSVLRPPSEDEMLAVFARAEIR